MKKLEIFELIDSLNDYLLYNKKLRKQILKIKSKLNKPKSKFSKRELLIVSRASYDSLFE